MNEYWEQSRARAAERVEFFTRRQPNKLLARMASDSLELAEARIAGDWERKSTPVAILAKSR